VVSCGVSVSVFHRPPLTSSLFKLRTTLHYVTTQKTTRDVPLLCSSTFISIHYKFIVLCIYEVKAVSLPPCRRQGGKGGIALTHS
jgi:hypothetical protein